MTTAALSPIPLLQFFDPNGNELAGGKLFTYAAGTTTKLATYTDSTGTVANTNPVILNANGQAGIWLPPGTAYKFTLSPATDTDPPTNPFWTVDEIVSPGSAVFVGDGGSGGAQGLVPAPSAGYGALNYILFANGSWGAIVLPSQAANTFLANLTGSSAAPAANSIGSVVTALAGTTSGTLAAGNDSRFGGVIQKAQYGGSYSLVASDAGVEQYFTVTATLTIPANSSVPFPIGTVIPVCAKTGVTLTISINTDTLIWVPSGSSGARTVTGWGRATLQKIESTAWTIVGAGVT